jgi:hypothetical protein
MCKRFIIKCCAKYLALFIFCITILVIQSCSLVKIESDQVPLSTTDLNTRLLTQSFVSDAANRVEKAADSILDSSNDIDLQTKSLQWKINTLSSFRKVGFQTSPKLALMDSWTLMLAARDFFSLEKTKESFYPYDQLVLDTAEENLNEIEKIAKHLLTESDFTSHLEFAKSYARKNPLKNLVFYHKPIREDYQKFKRLPDSLSIETVGSLSEVVADLTNKLTYTSENTGKQLQWNTELLFKENGIDSLRIRQISDSLNVKFSKLILLAEETPELFGNALNSFQKDLDRFNEKLNNSIVYSMDHLSNERKIIGDFIKEERVELDSIIIRERKAITKEAKVLSRALLDDTMSHVQSIIKTVLGYLIVLLAVIIFLPFLIGYYTGKTLNKSKNKSTNT